MKKNKSFDCVEMKNAIQAKLQKEYEGLTSEQVREKRQKKLATSEKDVALKWRRLAQSESAKEEFRTARNTRGGGHVMKQRAFSLTVLLATALVAISAHAAAAVWYVDKDNTGAEGGTSWGTAYTTIQPAIDAAYNDGGSPVLTHAQTGGELRTGVYARDLLRLYDGSKPGKA